MTKILLIMTPILLLSNLCQAGLKIFYEPAAYQFDFLAKSGVTRSEDYINPNDAEDFLTSINQSSKAASLSFLRYAFEKGMIDEMIGASESLSRHVTPADGVIFLGRSSSTLGTVFHAYQAANDLPRNNLINIAFSGTPDTENLREGCPNNRNQARNLVTPENLRFYEKYLDALKLTDVTGKLYIVDIIATGGNLNSFLRVLVHYYQVKLKRELPDIYFVPLSNLEKMGSWITSAGKPVWKYGPNQKKLAFAPLPQYGMLKMTVDVIPLWISDETLLFFDYETVEYFTAFVGSFSAYRWNLKHFKEIQTPAQKDASKLYYDFLSQVLRSAFKKDMKASEAFCLEPGWEKIPKLDEKVFLKQLFMQ